MNRDSRPGPSLVRGSCSLLAATMLSASLGCGTTVEEDLTGIELTVTYDVEVEQLAVTVISDGSAVFAPDPLPDPPRSLDGEGETVVILLSEDLSGTAVDVRADGLFGGAVVASGIVAVTLVAQELVPATIHLGEPVSCGDGIVEEVEPCDDGNADDGDGCSSRCTVELGYTCTNEEGDSSVCESLCGDVECDPGQRCVGDLCVCDDVSCPGGCCDGGDCELRSFDTCGIGGATCTTCDSTISNTCAPEGTCLCGISSPCEPGQRCESGACFCDDLSCPDGCCEEGECHVASTEACGIGGGPCTVCDAESSDGCSEAGECACGDGPPCTTGRRCVSGECLCDDVACPLGCCTDGRCEARTTSTCGVAGMSCVACDPLASDSCSTEGSCSCGAGAPCAAGEHCVGGSCECDPASCVGCCQDGRCVSGDSGTACGSGGSLCEVCPDGDTCSDGVCSGCNATSCPDGCCSGATCRPRAIDACAPPGAGCATCDALTADSCNLAGECGCGAGPTCAAGQRCLAGECVCDDLSCATGCCSAGGSCVTLGVTACAPAGATCVSCDDTLADNCSSDGSCRCGSGPPCPAGLHCDGGACVCDGVSCPDGCCAGTVCEARSFATCGTGGGACTACPSTRADGCDASGTCLCGAGAQCDAGEICSAGGLCTCDPASCSGCCDGNQCVAGTTTAACGSGGAACETCPGGDSCIGGACSSCDAATCPNGCCSGATCQASTFSACGMGGDPCVACSSVTADLCDDGACLCGGLPACASGTTCGAGSCSCDTTSCPDGCCDVDGCHPRSVANCGAAGGACTTCDPVLADNCSVDGICRCGVNPPCAVGGHCVAGSCVCDGVGCPGGCCLGSDCRTGEENNACGINGDPCVRCRPLGLLCVDFQCQ